jgi:hypothetical protein
MEEWKIEKWGGIGFISLCFLWLILQISGFMTKINDALRPFLSVWALGINLFLVPFWAAMFHLRHIVSVRLRLLFGTLFIISITLAILSFQELLIPTAAVIAFVYLEIYWIIPKWNSKHNVHSSITKADDGFQ